jgi:hypothetical protein
MLTAADGPFLRVTDLFCAFVQDELFWSICNEQAYFPRFLPKEAKHILDLVRSLTGISSWD